MKNYFRIALRNIFKHRLHSIINILGLTIGLSCCMFILLSCEKKQDERLSVGVNRIEFSFNGLTRSFLVHIPDSLDEESHPVLFAFHGGQGTNTIYPPALEDLITHKQWVGVYPQGVGGFWNSDIGTSSANDTGFVRIIIAWLHERLTIDDNRIYALGFSNGAIFCHKMARESDIFAAIAPVNGSWLTGQSISSTAPLISVFQVSSKFDEIVPYSGGSPQGLSFQAVPAMMDAYAAHNGCSTSEATLDDNSSITIYGYTECADQELKIYKLNNTTHFLSDATWNSIYPVIVDFLDGKSK